MVPRTAPHADIPSAGAAGTEEKDGLVQNP